jgi:hypothetical protein
MSTSLVSTCVLALMGVAAISATSQSFRVQCPTAKITHSTVAANNAEPTYSGPTVQNLGADGYLLPASNVNFDRHRWPVGQ